MACNVCEQTNETEICEEKNYIEICKKFDKNEEVEYTVVECKYCGFICISNPPDEKHRNELYNSGRINKKYNWFKQYSKCVTTRFKLDCAINLADVEIGKSYKKYCNYQNKFCERMHVFYCSAREMFINKNIDSSKLNKYFLDIGCSYGSGVYAASTLGYNAMGIDSDKSAISKAKEIFLKCKFKTIGLKEFVENEGKDLRFDLIYCAEVLEHYHDPNKFIKAISNLMNHKAILYLTTPDIGHESVNRNELCSKSKINKKSIRYILCSKLKFEKIKFFSKFCPKKKPEQKIVIPPEHLCFFKRKDIQMLFDRHNLEVIKFFERDKAKITVIARKV